MRKLAYLNFILILLCFLNIKLVHALETKSIAGGNDFNTYSKIKFLPDIKYGNETISSGKQSVLTLSHNSPNTISVKIESSEGDYIDEFFIENGSSLDVNLSNKTYYVSVIYQTISSSEINTNLPDDSIIVGFETRNVTLENDLHLFFGIETLDKFVGVSSITDFNGDLLDSISNFSDGYYDKKGIFNIFLSIGLFNGLNNSQVEIPIAENLYVAIGNLTDNSFISYNNWYQLINNSELSNSSFIHINHELDANDNEGKIFDLKLTSSPFIEATFPIQLSNEYKDLKFVILDRNFGFVYPFVDEAITIFGVNGIQKQEFTQVRLINNESGLEEDYDPLLDTPIAETVGINFDENNMPLAMDLLRVDESQNLTIHKDYVFPSSEVDVQGNSLFWEMSVSYANYGYLIGLLIPYSKVGPLSDTLGNSYNQGFNTEYKLYCDSTLIKNEKLSKSINFSIDFPNDDCNKHELVFEFDSYLFDQKYRSSASYKFDETLLTNQANGAAYIKGIQLFSNEKRIIDSTIREDSLINVEFFLELPTEFELELSTNGNDWIKLESEFDYSSNSIKSSIPTLADYLTVSLRIHYKFWGEEITQNLNGFLYVDYSNKDENKDSDNDGVSDNSDAFPLDPNESVDTDNDGIGNNADSDDDGDGVSDSVDAYPLDSTRSSQPNTNNTTSDKSSGSSGGSMYFLVILLFVSIYRTKKRNLLEFDG